MDINSNKINLATQFTNRFSRNDAEVARTFILKKLKQHDSIKIDCANIALSPTFADECFGIIAKRLGRDDFLKKIEFENLSPTLKSLLNCVISRRLYQLN